MGEATSECPRGITSKGYRTFFVSVRVVHTGSEGEDGESKREGK